MKILQITKKIEKWEIFLPWFMHNLDNKNWTEKNLKLYKPITHKQVRDDSKQIL